MKRFEIPTIEVTIFNVEDIVTTSVGGVGGDQELERD